ncbi:MAG: lipoate--protein ligase family protein [Natronomonas sp.]
MTRILRGRFESPAADRAATRRLVDDVGSSGEPVVRVWVPPRQLAFGRIDAHSDGYETAKRAARARGYPPQEREVGGRAVAYTGVTTLAFVRMTAVEGRSGISDRYDDAVDAVRTALGSIGVDAIEGEPEATFCPGTHSLQADGKIAGLAQRIGDGVAQTAGIVIVAETNALTDVLDPVYDALGVPFDPATVGSVSEAGGPADPVIVRDAVESTLAGDGQVESIENSESGEA